MESGYGTFEKSSVELVREIAGGSHHPPRICEYAMHRVFFFSGIMKLKDPFPEFAKCENVDFQKIRKMYTLQPVSLERLIQCSFSNSPISQKYFFNFHRKKKSLSALWNQGLFRSSCTYSSLGNVKWLKMEL